MTNPHSWHHEAVHEALFRSADVHAIQWRRDALDEIGRMLGQSATEVADEMTITSVQHGAHYTAVAVAGPVDARSTRQLAAHLRGLITSGTRHLVVDLSGVRHIGHELFDLMRLIEARMMSRNGAFELTGLGSATLHAMEDEPLREVFALYRATLEDDVPESRSWAALRCPQGISDVPEPRTSSRHRAFFDVGYHREPPRKTRPLIFDMGAGAPRR